MRTNRLVIIAMVLVVLAMAALSFGDFGNEIPDEWKCEKECVRTLYAARVV